MPPSVAQAMLDVEALNLLDVLLHRPPPEPGPHDNCTCCRHWRAFEHAPLTKGDIDAREARREGKAPGIPLPPSTKTMKTSS